MKFWIVTPNYNQLDWLKLCIASVRDQVATGLGHSVFGAGPNGENAPSHEPLASSSEQAANSAANEKTTLTCNDLNEDEVRLNATASVAVHHHVQDGGSTDGTVDFLAKPSAIRQMQRTAGNMFSRCTLKTSQK